MDRVLAWLLRFGIAAYRAGLRPLLGGVCRFSPSCSAYAEEAVRVHGGRVGLRLTVARILRCRPGRPGGHDPVPPAMASPPETAPPGSSPHGPGSSPHGEG